MMQFAGNDPSNTQLTARQREAKRLRTRAELLLKTATDLLDSHDAPRVERQELAYQLSNEALALLSQLRGSQSKT